VPRAKKSGAMTEWIEQNPLRKWRLAAGLTLAETAVTLGVGQTAISTWENGAYLPKWPNLDKMAQITGIENIAGEWEKWYKSRPSALPGVGRRGGDDE
jgi:transcriptional regulator with XRE-family HTH domain